MSTIDEKRVYSDSTDPVGAYVGSSMGVVRVKVSDSLIGEFSLCHRAKIRAIAAGSDTVAVGTDEDVLVADVVHDPEAFTETNFGAAVAVGYHDSALVAAGPDGRIARRRDGEWETLETDIEADVRSIDGDLIGTDRGVYRMQNDRLVSAGLEDVRDVSAVGVPLAATSDGLYKLGNGWMEELSGSFDIVVAAPTSEPGTLERAYAVAADIIYEYDDEWVADERLAELVSKPPDSDAIVGIGYGETVYAVTASGTFLAAGTDSWRSHALGIAETTGLAVPQSMPR